MKLDQAVDRFDVGWVYLEDLLVDRDRVVRLVQDVFVDGGRFHELLALIGRRWHHLGLTLVDARKVLVALRLLEEALEGIRRHVMLVVEIENAFVVFDRAVDLPEILLANLRCAEQEANRELRIVRTRDHLFVDSGEGVGSADRRAQSLELGLRTRMPRVFAERTRVALEGSVQVAQ